jgi:hypothetical protein
MHIKKPVPPVGAAFKKFLELHRLILCLDVYDGKLRARLKDGNNTYACLSMFTDTVRTDYYYTGHGPTEIGAIRDLMEKVSGKTLYFLAGCGWFPYKLEMPILETPDA